MKGPTSWSTTSDELASGERVRRLVADVVIAGVSCSSDGAELEVYDDSWSSTLSAPLTRDNLTIPVGGCINPDYTGTLRIQEAAWLIPPAEVLPVGEVHCVTNAVVWPGGVLQRCDIAKALTRSGYTFAAGKTFASNTHSVPEIREVLLSLGVDDALAWDGGDSASLIVDGTILEQPSDYKDRSIPFGLRISR